MKKQRFVLDTSAFTNLGRTKKEINKNIEKLVELISKCKEAGISCYTPPLVWKELKGMLERKRLPKATINKLDAWLIQKSPSRYELRVPAEFLYEYVSEVRSRFNKGLRESEKAVLAKGGNRPDPAVIKDLRDKYRIAMREGMVDSKEDLEVLLLAKELDAGVVAKDSGIARWAKDWGIRFIDANTFPKLIKEYINKKPARRKTTKRRKRKK
jgi:RNA ligase partner protein